MPNTPMNFMASGLVWSTMTIASMNPNRMPERESNNRAALFDFIAIISLMTGRSCYSNSPNWYKLPRRSSSPATSGDGGRAGGAAMDAPRADRAINTPIGHYLISGSGWPQGDKTLRLWDVQTGKELL